MTEPAIPNVVRAGDRMTQVWISRTTTAVILLTWSAAIVALRIISVPWLTVAGVGALLSFVLGIAVLRFSARAKWQTWIANLGLTTGFLGALSVLLLPACESISSSAAKVKSWKNLKHIGMAFHNYHELYGRLPPAAVRANDGTPLLSWRVSLLPFLGEEELYKQFRLDEPWDGSHNRELLARMPAIYRVTGQDLSATTTYYQVLIGKGTAFERDGLSFANDFPDGAANTILFVEAVPPVPWSAPEEVVVDESPLLPKVGGIFRGRYLTGAGTWNVNGCSVVTGNGATQFLSFSTIDEAGFRARVTRNGGETLPIDK